MAEQVPVARPRDFYVYLPYADEQATGMQRYASQMILALRRAGLTFNLIIGELQGEPAWLEGIPHTVAVSRRMAKRLPRAATALARLIWLQSILPARIGRAATLLVLGPEVTVLPRFRQIAVVHDLTDLKPYSERTGLSVWLRNALHNAGLRRSVRVVAISEATRRDLIEMFKLEPEQVEVVYEGFDPELFKPKSWMGVHPAPRPFLLYAGTLDPHKNIAFLLEVYRRFRERVDGVEIRLVGRHDPDRVRKLIEAVPASLRRDIHFAGFVDDQALARMMAECTAFVFPSRNEGFGLAPVEAMACGAPVVAAAAGSLPEVIGSGGTLLSPDDAEAWTAELVRIFHDGDYRQQLVEKGLTRSRLFSWDDAAEAYIKLMSPPAAAAG